MTLKFSGHLDMFFDGQSVTEKVKNFAELGYPAVELWCHWDYSIPELAAALKKYNLALSGLCTRFIPLNVPSERANYLTGLQEAIEACHQLNCHTIISQVGAELDNVSRTDQKQAIIEGLKASSKLLDNEDITLVIEPLNTLINHKGYFLSTSLEAAEIIRAVNHPKVKILFDIYHQQITEGNLINNIRSYYDLIGHFHIADNPGRFQPGTGEINYPNIFAVLSELGYQGYVGMEFFQQGDSWLVAKEFAQNYL